jgi:hypothetical protein
MFRQGMLISLLLLGSLTGINGREAEAANEDVPKGPGFNAPQGKPTATQGEQKPAASTGSINGGEKKGPVSGSGASDAGSGGKGGASPK